MPKDFARCVGRTFSIEEAKQIADRFRMQGYKTHIVETKKGSLTIYEVWAGKKAEGFEIKNELKPKFLGTD